MPGIPVALISLTDGEAMDAAESKTMTVAEETGFRADIYGGQMSSFSSWGVSPDLRLLPDITALGGNILSCYDDGQYGIMSGTSMATPHMAGISALVMVCLGLAMKKWKWLGDYALPISLVLGMISAIPITAWLS